MLFLAYLLLGFGCLRIFYLDLLIRLSSNYIFLLLLCLALDLNLLFLLTFQVLSGPLDKILDDFLKLVVPLLIIHVHLMTVLDTLLTSPFLNEYIRDHLGLEHFHHDGWKEFEKVFVFVLL
jgi:hypothetical protein